tara:strand:- start:26041 stop:26295 length:255 start_codon:yes stop_codon:yes gene_type:complete
MSVKLKVYVKEAKYIEESDSILIFGECDKGTLRHQIHSACFTFGTLDKKQAMVETAELMLGKTINIVFDGELDDKIKDKHPLSY